MRHSKLDYNEIVRYIGQDCVYDGYTYLKTGDLVHIERQMTGKRVAFACKWGGHQYTLKMPRDLFETLPNRPNMYSKLWNKNGARPEELQGLVNGDVRYVLGQLL